MSTSSSASADSVRQALIALSTCVREMTPAGAKPVQASPTCFNLLARPVHNACRICGLPGHSSSNIQHGAACHDALNALIAFWDGVTNHLDVVYKHSERFRKAIADSEPTYEMRLDGGPVVGGDLEVVLVDRLMRNWLKCQSHFARVRAKANFLLGEEEMERYEVVAKELNAWLCQGMTLSELYERSVDTMQE